MPSRGKKLTLLFATLAVVVLGVAGWIGWPWVQFYWRFESIGLNDQGFPEYRHRSTGIIMVRLPGGTFWMGAQKEDPKGRNYDPEAEELEGPVHTVTLSPFLIAKYEVTQPQWTAVMGSNSSVYQRGGKDAGSIAPGVSTNDLPVDSVSWLDCQEFFRITGLGLPTEAQWEYACRAGTRRPNSGTESLDDIGWYKGNSGQRPHAVGGKNPNEFGLHDMRGNVFEWCQDIFDEKFYSGHEVSRKDPRCTSGSEFRVVRGGGWRFDLKYWRPTYRTYGVPSDRSYIMGFRPAAPCP